MLTDEVLYEQFWNGDKKAADELVRRHGDLLFLFINGYLRDSHESKDPFWEKAASVHTFTKQPAILQPVSGQGEGYISALKSFTLRYKAKTWQRPGSLRMKGQNSSTMLWRS